jgi:hypothetical protein
MGVVKGISHDEWPRQSPDVGKPVNVCFNYDTNHKVRGTIVRDDFEEPWVGIIQLETGKYVLMTECQYSTPRRS